MPGKELMRGEMAYRASRIVALRHQLKAISGTHDIEMATGLARDGLEQDDISQRHSLIPIPPSLLEDE